jgi:hypothetical protein
VSGRAQRVVALLLVGALAVGCAASPRSATREEPSAASPSTDDGDGVVGLPPGTALRPVTSLVVTEANQVLSGLDVTDTITIDAPGVVIRRSRFTGHGALAAVVVKSGSVRIEQCEISGDYTVAAVMGDDWTVSRCELYGLPADGVKLGNRVRLESSWLHDWAEVEGNHADGAQLQSGVQDVTIVDNVIDIEGNSAIFIAPDLGPNSPGPVVIRGNTLGGGNYTLYVVDGAKGTYTIGGVQVVDNRFLRTARYGPADMNLAVHWEGNVWDDTGEPLTMTW